MLQEAYVAVRPAGELIAEVPRRAAGFTFSSTLAPERPPSFVGSSNLSTHLFSLRASSHSQIQNEWFQKKCLGQGSCRLKKQHCPRGVQHQLLDLMGGLAVKGSPESLSFWRHIILSLFGKAWFSNRA